MNQPEITPETRRDSKSVSGGSGVVDPSESKLCQVDKRELSECCTGLHLFCLRPKEPVLQVTTEDI